MFIWFGPSAQLAATHNELSMIRNLHSNTAQIDRLPSADSTAGAPILRRRHLDPLHNASTYM